MPSMTLVPVDHEPDFGSVSLVPVDHNPFGAEDMIHQARAQLASQPERFPTSYGNPEADAAAMQPETFANPYVRGLIDNAATLPKRAIDASAADLTTMGSGQPMQSIGPAVETAMMMTGGAGAVPAEANTLRAGIKAYHGSPHDFDAFDLSKIGTGEGAQAYGHGLYFAENEAVAKQYEKALSAAKDLPSDVLEQYFQPGQIIKGYSGLDLVKKYDPASRAVTVRSVDRQGNPTQDLLGLRDRTHTTQPSLAELNQAFKERGLPEYKPGRMYEVGINADPEHFLDWDKPLTPDSLAKVQSAAQSIKPNLYERVMGEGRDLAKWALQPENVRPDLTGQQAIGALKRGLGSDASASQALREAGIPGIKYLDQGSRASGEGSHNYVVFNDKLIDIVRKYAVAGIALPPAIAAEYEQMKASQAQPNYAAGLGRH